MAPRRSAPAFGASSMPRPAPSTVPVSRPIMNPPPPPLPSLSYRSKLSAIVLLLPVDIARRLGGSCMLRRLAGTTPPVVKETVDRRAGGVNESEDAVHARRYGAANAPRGLVDPAYRVADRCVHTLGTVGHPRG